MKNKSIFLLVISVFVIGIFGFCYFNSLNDSNESLSYDNVEFSSDDDNYSLNFSGGEFDYQLSIGDEKSIQDIFSSFQIDVESIDFSAFKIISNSDDEVIKFDDAKKSFKALGEGESKVNFSVNGLDVVLNLIVKPVSTSNASVDNYKLKAGSSPRFNLSVSGGKLIFTIWDYTGINTKDINLYLLDSKKNVQKELNLSFKNLVSGKSVKYQGIVNDKNILNSTKNYYHLVIKDKSGNMTDSYFSIIKKKNTYTRALAPRVNNLKLVSNKEVSFRVKDGSKIKSLVMYDVNNNNSIVLSKSNIISSTVFLNITKVKMNSNNRYNMKIYAEDVDGNSIVKNISFRVVNNNSSVDALSASVGSSTNSRILIIGNSKTWRGGTKSLKSGAYRPSYEFIKLANRSGKLTSTITNNDILKISSGATSVVKSKNIVITTKGGATISSLASKYSSYITDGSYDIVIMQEQTDRSIGDRNAFLKGVKKVLNMLENKHAIVYIRTSWPRNNSSFKSNVTKMDNNLSYVINELKKNSLYSSFEFYPLRDAKAFRAAKDSGISVHLNTSNDINHQNKNGAYLAGACIYAKVYNNNPANLGYSDIFISKSTAAKLAKIAYDTCA